MNKLPIWKKVILYVVLISICAVTLLPLVWMLSASLKLDKDVFRIPIEWIPSNPAWSNYQRIWEQVPMLRVTFNTFKVTVITTIIQAFTCSFAAYGFAKCQLRGRNLLFPIYVATIAVPWQVYMLPQMGLSIATLVIFTFVTNWNDFMGPMIYLNSTEMKTVQLGIRMFMGQYSTEYGLIMAASVVSLIPVVIVFLIFQKQFVQGIATSGLKG